MKSTPSIHLSFCLVLVALLALLPSASWALSTSSSAEQQQQQKDSEEATLELMAVAKQLKDAAPEIPTHETLVVATMLRDLAADKLTLDMTKKMRAQNEDPQLKEYLSQATPKDIATGLYQIMDEVKSLSKLFEDPQRAVEALNQDGMIPDEAKLKFYRENPQQLKEDLTGVLHMSFVAFASTGGYL